MNIPKGGRYKLDNNIEQISIEIDWKTKNKEDITIDSNCLLLNCKEHLIDEKFFIYYDNPNYTDSVIYTNNDNCKEQFLINFKKLDNNIKKMVFLINIFQPEKYNFSFNNLEYVSITIKDIKINQTILKFVLEDKDLSIEKSLNIGELYLKNDEWRFRAVGMGQKEGLVEFLHQYKLF